jgi:heterodisulfide reductase subunit B
MKKPMLVVRNCPRCGRQTTATAKAIHGADSLHKKFVGLCSTCVTPKERAEILDGQAKAILKKVGGFK